MKTAKCFIKINVSKAEAEDNWAHYQRIWWFRESSSLCPATEISEIIVHNASCAICSCGHLSSYSYICVANFHCSNIQAQYTLWCSNFVAVYSNKVCNNSGLWSITNSDYSTCPASTMLRERYLYHAILLSVSIAMAIPAIIIFLSYR
jgi:hypothetical protein